MRFLFTLLLPFLVLSQDNILIGDVDCNSEINSEDASLILQFITNVIDELPCQENMSGLTPEQLQEIINMMDEQLSVNYTGGGSSSYPIMISNESDNPLIFTEALNYCYDLEENGYNDWYMPLLDELTYAASGGVEFPDEKTDDYLWTRTMAHANAPYITTMRLIALTYNAFQWEGGSSDGASSTYVRCVRFGDTDISSSSSSGSSAGGSSEQNISMIGPMYSSTNFPDFSTWDNEEGMSIYYADAFRFCNQLIYDNYDDWRLPTVTAMHNYVQNNPQEQFVIPDHDTSGWGTFLASAIDNNTSSSIGSDTYLSYNVPTVHISGSNHETLPNQILFYGAMGTYSMINCFCFR